MPAPQVERSGRSRKSSSADRVWTVPNAISALRIALIPVIAVLIAVRSYPAAFAALLIAGFSDWVDGVIARGFHQSSALGGILDPVADRLLIICSMLALAIVGLLPWWLLVAVGLRDLLLGMQVLQLAQHGYGPLPVHFLGKAGTALLMFSIPALVFAGLGAAPFFHILYLVAFAGCIWGLGLYWLAGGVYISQGMHLLKRDRAAAKSVAKKPEG